MISRLHVQNYKSLHDTEIKFGAASVLVGANGGGKSNIVSSILFASNVYENGILEAIAIEGGVENICPRILKRRDTSFTLSFELEGTVEPKAEIYKGSVRFKHAFSIHLTKSGRVSVLREALEIQNPLALLFSGPAYKESESLATYLSAGGDADVLTIEMNVRKTKCKIISDNRKHFLTLFKDWAGFTGFPEDIDEILFAEIIDIRRKELFTVKKSEFVASLLLSVPGQSMVEFSGPLMLIKYYLSRTRKSDVRLSVVKEEQASSHQRSVGCHGENLPSVLRGMLSEVSDEGLMRIRDTLESVAPHVEYLSVRKLPTGREFVQFRERWCDRLVESWNASDGTMKLLATLAAIESQPRGSMLLLEEPETHLHPWALEQLFNHIMKGLYNRHIQFMISSHSPVFISKFPILEIQVVDRSDTGNTRIRFVKDFNENITDSSEFVKLWLGGMVGGIPRF